MAFGVSIAPERVAVYIRWSTEDQAAGTTLQVQREACLHYVRSQGWKFAEELCFVDDGWSGGNLARPAMSRLRAKVAAGALDCVVVYKIDRLSRNLVDAVQLVLREWEGRCHVKSVREPIDTTTELGRMIFGVLAMFADFERSAIRDRTQAGKRRRIAAGEQMHARPAYGYRADPAARGRWRQQPEEAAWVRRMFDLAAGGAAAGAIVRHLNGAGVRTRAGRPWSLRAVLWILHNRTYIGEVRYGAGADRITVATAAAPALIDRQLFEGAQARLAAHGRRRRAEGSRAASSPHLLTGLARCPCGGPLVFKAAPNGGYYRCAHVASGTCQGRGSVPALAVEDAVQRAFLRRVPEVAPQIEHFTAALQPLRDERRALAATLGGLRRAETRRQAEGRHVLERLRRGELTAETAEALRADLARAGEAGAAQMAQLTRAMARLDQRLSQTYPDPRSVWPLLPVPVRREILRSALANPIILERHPGRADIRIDLCWAI